MELKANILIYLILFAFLYGALASNHKDTNETNHTHHKRRPHSHYQHSKSHHEKRRKSNEKYIFDLEDREKEVEKQFDHVAFSHSFYESLNPPGSNLFKITPKHQVTEFSPELETLANKMNISLTQLKNKCVAPFFIHSGYIYSSKILRANNHTLHKHLVPYVACGKEKLFNVSNTINSPNKIPNENTANTVHKQEEVNQTKVLETNKENSDEKKPEEINPKAEQLEKAPEIKIDDIKYMGLIHDDL